MAGRSITRDHRATLPRAFRRIDYGLTKAWSPIRSRGNPEMTSMTLKVLIQDPGLLPLVPCPRRAQSEHHALMRTAGHMLISSIGFSDLTMRTFRKCACIFSGYITQLRSPVVNSIASAKAKKDILCRQILLSMSDLPIQLLELY